MNDLKVLIEEEDFSIEVTNKELITYIKESNSIIEIDFDQREFRFSTHPEKWSIIKFNDLNKKLENLTEFLKCS